MQAPRGPFAGYLARLTLRLADGTSRLSDETRERHAGFLASQQLPDGGFPGRDGPSDLYYTGFALRGLAILGALDGSLAERATSFLRGRLTEKTTLVDLASLVMGGILMETATGGDPFAEANPRWRDAMAEALEGFRRDDGGYAKAAEGGVSSTYYTFLVLICRELIERPPPRPADLVRFLYSRRQEDGGFLEISAMKRSGTNPTAAAVASLSLLDALTDDAAASAAEFLGSMQTEEGGLRANTRIPIADMLSTFTGLVSLVDLGATGAIDLPAVRRFALELELPSGGFHAALWDPGFDAEYSFYGLGTLALLATLPCP
jgi:geranylgeranyl transferase type-2 subunit beta